MTIIFLIGRILLGGYFIYSAYNHFANLKSLTGYAGSKGVPMPKVAVVATGVVLLLGGVSILTGMWIFIGLTLLALFLLVTSIMMHPFWKITDPAMRMGEQINFTKNIALMGALLMIMALAMY